MKVIDLLNMIANGEEVPKKIKFENYIYNWRNMQKDYFCEKINHSLESIIGDYIFNNLNLEVEIIEEEKELEEIEIQGNRKVRYEKDKFIESMFNHFYDMDLEVRKKLNDAIKEIKRIKKEGK